MSRVADWSLMTIVLSPIFGLVTGLISALVNRRAGRARMLIRTGMLISFLAAVVLTSVLGSAGRAEQATVACHLGAWSVISGAKRLPIVCLFRADFLAAIWLSVTTCIAWMALSIHDQSECGIESFGFSLNAALVSVASTCFVLSGSLLQSLFFWGAISWTTLAMIVCSSAGARSVRPTRMMQAGLLTDIALVSAIVLIAQVGGSDTIAEICSVEGLGALGVKNPPLPGLIGCLLIISAVGRSGLFPCFGWHRANPVFQPAIGTLIYAVGYVPSAIWLLLKCQPILVTSDVSMSLLGGMGTLGVVVGTFVACGQDGSHRLACLIGAQFGVMLAALGSGVAEAVPWCALHQCSLSLATLALFAASGGNRPCGRIRSWLIWCAAMSLSAAFPFWGGWTQQALLELNCHPSRWVLPNDEVELTTETADLATERSELAVLTLQHDSIPHWDWLTGLWFAQGMTAFAGTMAALEILTKQADSRTSDTIACPAEDTAITVAGGLLLVAGLIGGCLMLLAAMNNTFGVVTPAIRTLFPDNAVNGHIRMLSPNELGRQLFGQLVIFAGMFAAWRWNRRSVNRSSETSNWGSISRLSGQAMYIDQVEKIVLGYPLAVLATWARFTIDFDLSLTVGWMIRLPAWLGRQVESLQFEWKNFELVVILLGTASLLLALVLMI